MFRRHMFFEFGGDPRSRMFEKGDLKYVILDLLKDKPAHGYEIIRELEKRFHGFYSPSAGSVYPTLQLLEDMGYVKSVEQDGKKVYTITDEGKAFLKEREERIESIKDHMRGWGGYEAREDFHAIFRELRGIGRDIAREARDIDRGRMEKIKEIIKKACRDIEEVIATKEPGSKEPDAK